MTRDTLSPGVEAVEEEPFCGCGEHVELTGLALVLHEQGIGCNWWDRVPYRNQSHYESVEGFPMLSQEVWDAGPFPHDGARHLGDHAIVVSALTELINREAGAPATGAVNRGTPGARPATEVATPPGASLATPVTPEGGEPE